MNLAPLADGHGIYRVKALLGWGEAADPAMRDENARPTEMANCVTGIYCKKPVDVIGF